MESCLRLQPWRLWQPCGRHTTLGLILTQALILPGRRHRRHRRATFRVACCRHRPHRHPRQGLAGCLGEYPQDHHHHIVWRLHHALVLNQVMVALVVEILAVIGRLATEKMGLRQRAAQRKFRLRT